MQSSLSANDGTSPILSLYVGIGSVLVVPRASLSFFVLSFSRLLRPDAFKAAKSFGVLLGWRSLLASGGITPGEWLSAGFRTTPDPEGVQYVGWKVAETADGAISVLVFVARAMRTRFNNFLPAM